MPEPFATEHGVTDRCVCKIPDCRRWCGILPPKQQPGRKKARLAEVAVGQALRTAEPLPCPPILLEVRELWGIRCGLLPLAQSGVAGI